MVSEKHYYREELDYLRQLGKLLAQEKPHLAHFLAGEGGDLDVERLMEVFVFMFDNLYQKLEDEFSELTYGLTRILWASYLRLVPAMTVIAYGPKTDQLGVPVQACRNELIRGRLKKSSLTAQKVLPDNHNKVVSSAACHFTLTRDIWLQPLCIPDTRNVNSLREGIIGISFTVDNNVSPAMFDLNKITLWLGNEDDYTRHQLYLQLCECLMDAGLIAGEYHLPLSGLRLEATGFDNRNALLSWLKNVHSGYRVLQEHFYYPGVFFFLYLRGVAPLPDDLPINTFTPHLHSNRPLSADIKLRQGSLCLRCTSAINLFAHYVELVRPDGQMAEYPLRASRKHPDAYDIFQVSTITSKVKVSGTEISPGSQACVWPGFENF